MNNDLGKFTCVLYFGFPFLKGNTDFLSSDCESGANFVALGHAQYGNAGAAEVPPSSTNNPFEKTLVPSFPAHSLGTFGASSAGNVSAAVFRKKLNFYC